jgi:hypothetical protein
VTEPSKPLWRTAAGLSAIAAVGGVLLSAVGLLVTAGGDDPPTPGGTIGESLSSSPGSNTNVERPSFQTPVFSSPLNDSTSGFESHNNDDCDAMYEDGLHIVVDVPDDGQGGVYCIDKSDAPAISRLASVRTEVSARWLEMPSENFEGYGHAAIGLTCHTSGTGGAGSFYFATVTTNGAWEIDRRLMGEDLNQLEEGRRSDGWTAQTDEVDQTSA